MTQWSEFCKKYALENSITYSEASKLSIVKELYKMQKIEFIAANDAIFEMKLEAAIEKFDIEALEVLEPEPLVIAEVPEDAIVTVTYEPPANPQTGKIFVSSLKKIKKIGLKRT